MNNGKYQIPPYPSWVKTEDQRKRWKEYWESIYWSYSDEKAQELMKKNDPRELYYNPRDGQQPVLE